MDIRGFPLEEVVRFAKSRTGRVFRKFWGYHPGQQAAGSAAPHKGVTIGIADFNEKIRILKGMYDNEKLGDRCEEFGKDMMKQSGTRGVVWAKHKKTGRDLIVSQAAFNVSKNLNEVMPFSTGGAAIAYFETSAPQVFPMIVA